MTKTMWQGAITAMMVLATGGTVAAQDGAVEPSDTPPTWLASCSNQADPDVLACSMTQTLTVAETGQRLLAVTVQPGGETPSLLLSLPHGLSFAQGVGFATDDGALERFDFTTADVTGTYARVPLTDERLTALRAANTLKLNVVGVGGRGINFEVSLIGFSKTYDLLK